MNDDEDFGTITEEARQSYERLFGDGSRRPERFDRDGNINAVWHDGVVAAKRERQRELETLAFSHPPHEPGEPCHRCRAGAHDACPLPVYCWCSQRDRHRRYGLSGEGQQPIPRGTNDTDRLTQPEEEWTNE